MFKKDAVVDVFEAFYKMKLDKIVYCIETQEFMKFDEYDTDEYHILYANTSDEVVQNKWKNKTIDINLILNFTFKIVKDIKSGIIADIQETPIYQGLEVLDYLTKSQNNIVYNKKIQFFFKIVYSTLYDINKRTLESFDL